MKILIVGGGGREHAIAAAVAKSQRADKIYCAPGNAGIAQVAVCVPIGAMEFEKLVAFAKREHMDLTIVGMDDPLVGGLVDAMEAEGLRVFGPRKNAAVLEGSKAFSKDLMKKYGIPTAAYEKFEDAEAAYAYLERAAFPIVLKADGLALGKGVLICRTLEEAREGVKSIMEEKKFGSAGNRMVIEEFMTGREVSVLSFTDGRTIRIMTSAQDHKRAKDGDRGLNTGGMGAFSPSPFYTGEVDLFCREHIYQATVDAMAAEGREFKGVIFFGLMLTQTGPKVLEYNARFGDPEAQVVLPRMKNDLLEVMEACVDGTLDQIQLEFEENAAVCVVLASAGYPVSYKTGYPIYGLERFGRQAAGEAVQKRGKPDVREERGAADDCRCFHAGTGFRKEGERETIVTAGGRVLGITAKGGNLKEARAKAYEAARWVTFENKYLRRDIGRAIDEA
ncbi:MAG: phosphoribosylamine--glycine ligase [Clostridium sp.]|jgi:phosphoribosylamine--glycine ligase|nr:phosphoribosylamine--glycine ligase [Clostridium sp.]